MPPEEAWPQVGDYSCAFRMPASSLLSSCPSFPARLASCLLTSLPLPKGAAHPPREAPWDGADGGGSGCPIRSTAWPGLEKWLGRAWSLSPSFAPAGLWVSFPGLPACCLPSFPFCLRPGALFSCFPWTGPVEWPPRAQTTAAGPGRHCPLGKAPGRTCLTLLCRVRVGRGPLPWLACAPHSSPQPSPPQVPPLAWAAAHFSAVEPATPGPPGGNLVAPGK